MARDDRRSLARTPRELRDPGLTVHVSDERGRPVRTAGLAAWLRRVAPARARGEVNIALVDDDRVRALNRAYRRKNAATDVLSFPANSESTSNRTARTANLEPRTAIPGAFLGDIVIARGVARRQAARAGHSESTELRVLALHGVLHLLGYDHERDAGRMRRVEQRLRRKGGLREGLIERSGRPPHTAHRPSHAARVRPRSSAVRR